MTLKSRSLEILKDHFQHDILEHQDPWAQSEKAERLLQLLPDKQLNEALRRKWDAASARSSSSKWADIDALAKLGASKTLDGKALLEAKQDIVLEYTYPRLDVEVSKKQIHLLKSPFVIHPGTGRICVPIDNTRLTRFDPLAVPTVTDLLRQIDEFDRDIFEKNRSEKIQWYEKTTIKPYIDHFQRFVTCLLKEEKDVKFEEDTKHSMNF